MQAKKVRIRKELARASSCKQYDVFAIFYGHVSVRKFGRIGSCLANYPGKRLRPFSFGLLSRFVLL